MIRCVILILLALLLFACGPEPVAKPLICQQSTIDALSALHRAQNLPDYLIEGEARRPAEEFDANETFSVLTHLSMEPGYTLDYGYFTSGAGGEPILYARPVDQMPYLTFDELHDATGMGMYSAGHTDYLAHVQVDGTAEGFFELALLRLMGGQFYLDWHADYNDATALCDETGLEAIISELEKHGYNWSDKLARRARALDLAPVVEFEGNRVTVTFVYFTNWGAFLQQTYSFGREFPQRLMTGSTQELVPYDCGIQF